MIIFNNPSLIIKINYVIIVIYRQVFSVQFVKTSFFLSIVRFTRFWQVYFGKNSALNWKLPWACFSIARENKILKYTIYTKTTSPTVGFVSNRLVLFSRREISYPVKIKLHTNRFCALQNSIPRLNIPNACLKSWSNAFFQHWITDVHAYQSEFSAKR